MFNDEGDEQGFGAPPTVPAQTTYILNVENLVRTATVMASPNNTTSIDHNLYMPGNGYVYESNYTSGLRIFTERSVPDRVTSGGRLVRRVSRERQPVVRGRHLEQLLLVR